MDDFFSFGDDREVVRDDTVGADIKQSIEIAFLESINGCQHSITIDKRVICPDCKGRRADMTESPRKCFECGGRGSIVGNYGIRKKCTKCDGSGVQLKQKLCGTCSGLGVLREQI